MRPGIVIPMSHDLIFFEHDLCEQRGFERLGRNGRRDHHPPPESPQPSKPLVKPGSAKTRLATLVSRAIVMRFNYRNALRMDLS
jgi:hypothetical protein